ncbi:MAG: NUDIX domain-containing protein [Lachnospiraceae bacterium]|nr:NUDIX domain-containing protein [Lachnospiraceae bacterium]
MNSDMSVKIDEGYINIRVGALIVRDDAFLMVCNDRDAYYYSVGGRIKFGETAREAVVREVYEETGVRMEIDYLGFICENYFYGTVGDKTGRLVYEPGFYFYMKVPEDFEPVCRSATDDGIEERLEWLPFDTDRVVFPSFLPEELSHPVRETKHMVTDER